MPVNLVKAFVSFVDWFGKISPSKKIYSLITIMFIGLIFLLKYYDKQISTINNLHNNRVDSITFFYTNQLEKCNNQNKAEIENILSVLHKALEDQQKMNIETQKLKTETERLKQKR